MYSLVKFALISGLTLSLLLVTAFAQGDPIPASSAVSGQKLGSVLVYNFYTARTNEETDISLTNTNATDSVAVHLFFVNGTTNQAADTFVALAPRQTVSLLASNNDPGNAGYVVAVAVDATSGCPRSFNYLSGDAYLKLASGLMTSLPAEAFAAIYSGTLGTCNINSTTASLDFNGSSYNEAPRALAVDNVASLLDNNITLLVVNRLGGSLVFGANAASLGSNFGILYDGDASPFSFIFTSNNAQFTSPFSNTFPKVITGFPNVIPLGTSGWMKFWPNNDAGVLGAILNFNPNASMSQMAFSGGHNLRHLTFGITGTLTIPVYPPTLKADLALSLAHSGNFTIGSTGDYTLTVNNAAIAKPATGTIKITDTLPSNLTLQSFSGAGWNCTGTGTANVVCTNGSGLAAGASLPTLTLTVNVGAGTPGSITNTATVSVAPQQESNLTNNSASDTIISAPAPTAITQAATAVTSNTATLNGTVNPNGFTTDASFQYSTDSTLSSGVTTIPAQSGLTGTTAVAVNASLTGLTPGTTYYYRAVATSANGTGQDGIVSFRTLGATAGLINIDFQTGSNTYTGWGMLGSVSDTIWNPVGFSGTNLLFADGSGPSGVSIATMYTNYFDNTIQINPLLTDWVYTNQPQSTITLSGLAPNSVFDIAFYDGFYWQDFSIPAQPGLIAQVRPNGSLGSAGAPPFPAGTYGILHGAISNASGQITILDTRVSGGSFGTAATIAGMQILRVVNTPPTISSVANSRQQGSTASNSTIANVNDAEDAEDTLTVTVNGNATVNGVTVSGISVDSAGVVTANVVAACGAAIASFTLMVTDSGGLSTTATLNVTVNVNSQPTLGTYPNTSMNVGSNTTVTPNAAPTDNGTLSITASAPGFTGSFNVNPATGEVTISNAGPLALGNYTVTVTATDNCGLTVSKTFSLFVNCPGATITVTTTSDTVAADGACSLREAIQAANTNTAVNECPAGKPGLDTIYFAIGTGIPTINVIGSALPTITEPVVIDGSACQSTRVELNGATLTVAGTNGLTVSAGNSTLRNLVINRFRNHGIRLDTGGGNVIENCFIGTDVSGMSDRGNVGNGILIITSSNNRIGGTAPNQRNLISGNDQVGIEISASANNNVIQGNYIGTNVSGTQALGNVRDGIYLSSANAGLNMIGGTVAGAGNLISGNGIQPGSGGAGISISGSGNQVLGNLIGTDITGSLPLGNLDGLRIFNNQNVIGGTAQGAANIIAFSSQYGVRVGNGTGNSILSNSIFSNALLGIDLFPLGITANDAGDTDTGANNLQNFPVLTQATTAQIQGTLNSTANTTFTIQFFSNPVCDPSGNGEGQSFVGQTTVTTNASGNAAISFTPAGSLALYAFITATATDPNGNTSEFSACRLVLPPSLSINDVTVTEGNSGTVNAVFTVSLSGASAQIITMQFNTMGVTATSSSDYTATSGTLTFPPNTLTQMITVQVKGDTTIEPHETFFVNLSNLTNATITDNLGQGTILNDDCATITLSPASLPDGLTNTSYYQIITASPAGGYNYAVTSGALPNGLLLDPLSGLFSGAPTASGSYTFTIKATNVANGCMGTKTYTLNVGCPPVPFVTKWGSSGQLGFPYGVAATATGNVYVADPFNHRILKFDANGQLLLQLGGSYSSNPLLFSYPRSVAVSPSGDIYVADTDNNRIQKFDANGTFLLKWGSLGSGDGKLNQPFSVTVSLAGDVYVADTNNNRIQKFDANGNFLLKWGSIGSGDGQFNGLFGVAVDSVGNVYVVDAYNNRIQKFDANGNFLLKWGSTGSGNGQFSGPASVTVDTAGNIYVADASNQRIQKFDANGNFLLKWGSIGSGDGQFAQPYGVAVDTAGNVYVADYGNNRIQKFSQTPSPIANAGPDQTLTTTPGLPAPVTLNGTASTNPGGGPLTYQWREGTTVLGTGATLNVNLAVGTHTITLYATNQCLIPATDTVVIKVGVGPPAGG